LNEEGLAGFEYAAWLGIFSPVNTPLKIRQTFSQAVAEVLRDPDTISKIQSAGAEPMIGGPAELAALLKSELIKAEDIVKRSGITPE
jgi:tripartite-type tricarboxylate transporter receptor subunit TctC